MLDWYILAEDGKTPIKCTGDVVSQAQQFTIWDQDFIKNRRVALAILPNGYRVSTVFLGLDHSFNGGPPVLWETMVFGPETGSMDLDGGRYTSYDAAVTGHAVFVERWKLEPPQGNPNEVPWATVTIEEEGQEALGPQAALEEGNRGEDSR